MYFQPNPVVPSNHERQREISSTPRGHTAAGLVLGWFLLAFSLSLTGWFGRFPTGCLLMVGTVETVVGFAVLYALSGKSQELAGARGLKSLTRGQILRLYGTLALVLARQHVLPPLFAVPTGVLDISFAMTSFFVSAHLVIDDGHPPLGFFIWHTVGVVGLGLSVTLAFLTSSDHFGLVIDGITSQTIRLFPMSLVPTFIGPFVLILHLLALTAAYSNYSANPRTGSPER